MSVCVSVLCVQVKCYAWEKSFIKRIGGLANVYVVLHCSCFLSSFFSSLSFYLDLLLLSPHDVSVSPSSPSFPKHKKQKPPNLFISLSLTHAHTFHLYTGAGISRGLFASLWHGHEYGWSYTARDYNDFDSGGRCQ